MPGVCMLSSHYTPSSLSGVMLWCSIYSCTTNKLQTVPCYKMVQKRDLCSSMASCPCSSVTWSFRRRLIPSLCSSCSFTASNSVSCGDREWQVLCQPLSGPPPTCNTDQLFLALIQLSVCQFVLAKAPLQLIHLNSGHMADIDTITSARYVSTESVLLAHSPEHAAI